MGTFHTFGELQQFAEKLVKFKQTVLIKAARGGISDKHFKIVERGA